MRKRKHEYREIPIKFENKTEAGEAAGRDSSSADEDVGPLKSGDQSQKGGARNESAVEEETDSIEFLDPVTGEPEDRAGKAPLTLDQAQAQIEALTQEKTGLYDQLLRRQAEFENYRKRVERERADANHWARASILLELLPVLDNLERALLSFEKDGSDAEALRHGVELVHKQFRDALAKFGLQAVDAVGKTFDPHLHEAVTIEPTDEHRENTVIEEFQRGYKLGDRLLRPAKVKVAANRDE